MQEITLQYTHNTNFKSTCLYIFLITLTLFPNLFLQLAKMNWLKILF